MTCIKAQSMITPFINDKLSLTDLEEFLEHVNSCKNCREELEVYYALLTAMKQLDEDKNLNSNYSEELTEKLKQSSEKIFRAKYTYYKKKVILILTMIFVAIFIGFGYANKSELEVQEAVKSDFHIRRSFREPGMEVLEQQLQSYLLEHSAK